MSLRSPSTLLTLVRHGETEANVKGVWHGSTDGELTPRGRRQAELVARHLATSRGDARAVYASPLLRACDTAAAIAAALDRSVELDDCLREYHLGDWEGRTFRELARVERLFERMQADPDWAPGGGESARQVAERFAGALEGIAARHPGERVVVVGHGGALTLALGLLLDRDYSTWRRVMDNCAVSDLVLAPPKLLSFNEVAHLEILDEEPSEP